MYSAANFPTELSSNAIFTFSKNSSPVAVPPTTACNKLPSVSKIKKVTVVDTKKPELVIEGSFLNVCPNGKTSDVKISATDNYDGDITKNVKYKIEKRHYNTNYTKKV